MEKLLEDKQALKFYGLSLELPITTLEFS